MYGKNAIGMQKEQICTTLIYCDTLAKKKQVTKYIVWNLITPYMHTIHTQPYLFYLE